MGPKTAAACLDPGWFQKLERRELHVDLSRYNDRWCAVQVVPRHEVVVSAILRSKGYEEFVPMYRSKRQWSDRRKAIETPLFTGYVFCRLNSDLPWAIVTTPGVIRIVGTRKEVSLIDDREIEAIQLALKSGKVEPCSYLNIGDRVRIASGPLAGVEGMVTAYKNQCRFVLSVDPIQSSIALEIDGAEVIPVTKAAVAAGAQRCPGSRHDVTGSHNANQCTSRVGAPSCVQP
jgi:transcription antitermination factor NusG